MYLLLPHISVQMLSDGAINETITSQDYNITRLSITWNHIIFYFKMTHPPKWLSWTGGPATGWVARKGLSWAHPCPAAPTKGILYRFILLRILIWFNSAGDLFWVKVVDRFSSVSQHSLYVCVQGVSRVFLPSKFVLLPLRSENPCVWKGKQA